MTRTLILILAAAALYGCIEGTPGERFPLSPRGTLDLAPNADLGNTAKYTPTQAERNTFDDLFRKAATKPEVLRVMGHPIEIFIGEDGQERWRYPWGSSCIVGFAGNTVSMALYIGPTR